MKNNKGLGRGLESLFDQNLNTSNEEALVSELQINDIEPNPFQPRKHFDEDSLNELAQSVKAQGVLQPILVRRALIGYEIISGERRYRASKLAKLETIPAIIYDFDDTQMMEVGIIENIQREDLSVIEEAKSYQMLIDNLSLTQKQISERVGKSRSHIANMLRLLKLDDAVLDMINNEQLTMGHAKVLVNIDDKNKVIQLAKKAVNNNLTVREVEELAKEEKTGVKVQSKASSNVKTNEMLRLEQLLRDSLETSVKIKGKNKGEIVIDYSSRDELERILKQMSIL